jgi:F-type H+-transporting ATPase subunit delta
VLRSRVAKRYARALFEIALEKKQLELVESDLKTLKKGYRESEEFRELVDSPIISNQAKKQIFTEVYQKRLQELTFKFMLLLIQKNREMLLMQVIDDLSDLSDQYHGILRGEVFSVVPLTEQQIQKLTARLNTMTGKKVMITRHQDESLLGGFVIKLQDRIYDTSLRNKLNKLKQNLIES